MTFLEIDRDIDRQSIGVVFRSAIRSLLFSTVKWIMYAGIASFATMGWLSLIIFGALLAYQGLYVGDLRPWLPLLLYSATESMFLLFMMVLQRRELQRVSALSHRVNRLPALDPSQRLDIVREVADCQRNAQDLIQGWFFGANPKHIPKENIVEFIASALFNKHVPELSSEELDEIDHYVNHLEKVLEISPSSDPFVSGYKPEFSCMRPLLDPVEIHHRPLIFYLIIWTVNELTKLILYHVLGFRSYKPGSSQNLFEDNGNLNENGNDNNENNDSPAFWIRDQRQGLGKSGSWIDLVTRKESTSSPTSKINKTDIPLVFFHGLGIGFATYLSLFITLIYLRPGVSVILFEKPSIAMRLHKRHRLPQEFALEVKQSLENLGFEKAVFCGHSMGTVCVAWMCKFHPEIVHNCCFIDPICFSLWKHHVAYNFLYRKPLSFLDFLIKCSVASEFGISVYLRRYFCWYFNTFFWKDLPHTCSIYIATRDSIIHAESIIDYIAMWQKKLPHHRIYLRVMNDFAHGQVLTSSEELLGLVRHLSKLVQSDS